MYNISIRIVSQCVTYTLHFVKCKNLLTSSEAGRPKNSIFFWPAFVTRLLTPRSRKSGYEPLLGCRSGFDRGPFEKTFFDKVRTPKLGKSSLSVGPRSQWIGRGRISREGALDHRESRERRDKIFAAKTENANIFKKKNGSEKQFSVGILAAGKLTFFGGGYKFKTG